MTSLESRFVSYKIMQVIKITNEGTLIIDVRQGRGIGFCDNSAHTEDGYPAFFNFGLFVLFIKTKQTFQNKNGLSIPLNLNASKEKRGKAIVFGIGV